MKFFTIIIVAVFTFMLSPGDTVAQYEYISPKPNSIYHNPETNIILKNGSDINAKSLNPSLVSLSGSLSGTHYCKITLSDDLKTIIIYPSTKFELNEIVSVTVNDGFQKKSGDLISGVSFEFTTHPARSAETIVAIRKASKNIKVEEYGADYYQSVFENSGASNFNPECTLPKAEITSTGNEYKGMVFLRNQRLNNNICFARQIVSNEGDSVYAVFDESAGIDFKINLNGYLTYFDKSDSSFVMMDSGFNQLKKFYMGNGYPCDEHDILVYPNGHSFLMSYDPQIVDLTDYGGLPESVVTGLVIQELDASDEVVFQWRSWDYLQITDAVAEEFLTDGEVDYVHGNSLELDFDSNLLVSCRHLSAILKIDRMTGDIIWQMGGENNDFTFINDPGVPHPFYFQHDFRLLPDGNYSLFNNANFQLPQASGAKVYTLDQTAKTATLVWSYVHPQLLGYDGVNHFNLFGRAMGSAQLLPNGNWLIGWGLLVNTNFAPFPNVTEVDTSGNIVWEFRYKDSTLVSYRAFKFDFIRCGSPIEGSYITTFVGSDSADLAWGEANNSSSYLFQYKLFSDTEWVTIPVVTNSISLDNLIPDSVYDWRVQTICEIYDDTSTVSEIHQFTTISTSTSPGVQNNSSFSLYPNPASSQVTLELLLPEHGVVTLSLLNLLGEVVYHQVWDASAGRSQHIMPVKQFPKGVYTVQLASRGFMNKQQLVIY